jgi:hypothetical protein
MRTPKPVTQKPSHANDRDGVRAVVDVEEVDDPDLRRRLWHWIENLLTTHEEADDARDDR